MSTIISSIHDELYTMMSTLFPTKKVLADSLNIDNNDELFLSDGYAIYISNGVNTRRVDGCVASMQRQVTITLTKATYADHKDITKIKSCEKTLLEDHWTLVKDFSKNDSYTNLASTNRNYISDGGIERVFGESRSFITIKTQFELEYFESLL